LFFITTRLQLNEVPGDFFYILKQIQRSFEKYSKISNYNIFVGYLSVFWIKPGFLKNNSYTSKKCMPEQAARGR